MPRPSSLLALIAAFLLVTAAGLVWVGREVADSDRFARHVREALVSDPVRRLIVEEVADRVVAAAPVVGEPLRGPIEGAVDGVIRSDAFGDGFETTVATVHRRLVTGGEGPLVLDLSGAEALVREAVAAVDPRVAQVMPSGVLAAVDVGDRVEVPDFHAYDEAVDRGLSLSVLGAVITGGLALLAARERHRPLVVGGLAAALGGGLLLLGAAGLPELSAARVGEPLASDATRAVVAEMAESLRLEGIGLSALGLAVAAVGLVMGRRIPDARVV